MEVEMTQRRRIQGVDASRYCGCCKAECDITQESIEHHRCEVSPHRQVPPRCCPFWLEGTPVWEDPSYYLNIWSGVIQQSSHRLVARCFRTMKWPVEAIHPLSRSRALASSSDAKAQTRMAILELSMSVHWLIACQAPLGYRASQGPTIICCTTFELLHARIVEWCGRDPQSEPSCRWTAGSWERVLLDLEMTFSSKRHHLSS